MLHHNTTIIGASAQSNVDNSPPIIGQSSKYSGLSWEQKLQIHSTFFSTVAHSAKMFGVSAATFRKHRNQFVADAQFDCSEYADDFSARASHDENGNIIPRPRGRQTNKIVTAFNAVSYDPVPLETFCVAHGISSHVMNQRARFDKSGNNLNVVCRKINGVPHIMRLTDNQMQERADKTAARNSAKNTPQSTETV